MNSLTLTLLLLALAATVKAQTCDFDDPDYCGWDPSADTDITEPPDNPGEHEPDNADSGLWYVSFDRNEDCRLRSILYPQNVETTITFAYWFDGRNDDELDASHFAVVIEGTDGSNFEIWQATDLASFWRTAVLEISGTVIENTDYYINFVSTPDSSMFVDGANIGIDTIIVTEETTTSSPMTTTETSDTTDPSQTTPQPGDCQDGFESIGDGCYAMNAFHLNWVEASEMCNGLNARLIQIESIEEQLAVSTWASELYPTEPIWTGGSDNGHEGIWTWAASGENIFYDHWYTGRPLTNETLNCLSTGPQESYFWIDSDCDNIFYFICEEDKPAKIPIY